jgi:hypothetical protein
MIIDLLLSVLSLIGAAFIAIWPGPDFLPLPASFYNSIDWLGSQIGVAANFLPDGFAANLAVALSLVVAVNLFVIPFIAARRFRLPFASFNKG